MCCQGLNTSAFASALMGTTVLFSLNYCFLTEIVYKEKYLQYISFIFMSNRNQENLFLDIFWLGHQGDIYIHIFYFQDSLIASYSL